MLDSGLFGFPVTDQPLGFRQAVSYWSGSGGLGTTTITFSIPPMFTCYAIISADNNGPARAYYWGHTGYRWQKVHDYQVDSGNGYPWIEMWMGQPLQLGIAGGTSLVFTHNGNAPFPAGAAWEMNRPMKGEMLKTWYGWANNASSVDSSPDGNLFVTPNERNLVMIAGGVIPSGGSGPGVDDTKFTRGITLNSGLLVSGSSLPYPTQPYQPMSFFSRSGSPRWSEIAAFFR